MMMQCMSKRLVIAALLGLTLMLGASRPATAGLMGSTVNVSAYFPETTNLYVDPGDVVVSAGVEYGPGSYAGYNSGIQADITDDRLVLTLPDGGTIFSSGNFNGFILRVLSGPTILSATVDGSSEFSPISVTLLNGNEVQINYAGVDARISGTSSSAIAFTFAPAAVPEPSSLISGGIACALALGHFRRRKARAGA
ncbi:hypothetical protein [Paludisphaera sp.]|uniref:hypothetical protein n=1 Tax=Paludisphaera sp. TaxID=2017432 RepID=UPI00301C8553